MLEPTTMVHGTQRMKRKEKNEAVELRRAETKEKIGEGTKGKEKKLREKKQGKGQLKKRKGKNKQGYFRIYTTTRVLKN